VKICSWSFESIITRGLTPSLSSTSYHEHQLAHGQRWFANPPSNSLPLSRLLPLLHPMPNFLAKTAAGRTREERGQMIANNSYSHNSNNNPNHNHHNNHSSNNNNNSNRNRNRNSLVENDSSSSSNNSSSNSNSSNNNQLPMYNSHSNHPNNHPSNPSNNLSLNPTNPNHHKMTSLPLEGGMTC
jgi:hypothetical protein